MSLQDATFYAEAAGLRGESAAQFVRTRMVESPVLSLAVQRKLFEDITAVETVADVRRILLNESVQARYGAVAWEDLSGYAQEIVFDLRYRGDYTSTTRALLQPLLVARDDEGLRAAMRDTAYWSQHGVPLDRIRQRGNLEPYGMVAREAS
jgi:hypothetical protein